MDEMIDMLMICSTKSNAAFEWSRECKELFEKLKRALISAPVLAYPKFGPGNEFIMETDATTIGLEAAVAYASHSVNSYEKSNGIFELETLFRPVKTGTSIQCAFL